MTESFATYSMVFDKPTAHCNQGNALKVVFAVYVKPGAEAVLYRWPPLNAAHRVLLPAARAAACWPRAHILGLTRVMLPSTCRLCI